MVFDIGFDDCKLALKLRVWSSRSIANLDGNWFADRFLFVVDDFDRIAGLFLGWLDPWLATFCRESPAHLTFLDGKVGDINCFPFDTATGAGSSCVGICLPKNWDQGFVF